MPLKVNDFVIQAQVNEEGGDSGDECGEKTVSNTDETISISDSQKQEIIDECFEMMKEYIKRDNSRF